MLKLKVNTYMESDLMGCERYVAVYARDARNWWILGSRDSMEDALELLRMERADTVDGADCGHWLVISPWGDTEAEA